MTLREYIEKQDRVNKKAFEICAERWGATPRAVETWYYGHRKPSLKAAKKIMKASDELSLESIYGGASSDSEAKA